MNVDSYGLPALHIGALRIWVHGYQFPDAIDAWDGNWLNITACYEGHGTRVVVAGPILDTVSFQTFAAGLRKIHSALEGEARLESVEPNLAARVIAQGKTGGMLLRAEMTPDHMSEGHWFEQALDQSYLRSAIAACEEVLRRFPIRQASERGA
jgi:hypothetical protein